MWVHFSLFGESCQNSFENRIPVFLSQIRVAASVKNFDPDILNRNSSHFQVVYLLRAWCVKAFKPETRPSHLNKVWGPVPTWDFFERQCFFSIVLKERRASAAAGVANGKSASDPPFLCSCSSRWKFLNFLKGAFFSSSQSCWHPPSSMSDHWSPDSGAIIITRSILFSQCRPLYF